MEDRYWDSSVFLAWLLPEPENADKCKGVISLAEGGDLRIVASTITLTEVVKLKKSPRLKKEQEEIIKLFFDNEFIILRNVDYFVAEYARNLIWAHSHLKPKDSIHLATAHILQLEFLDTFDEDLLKLNGLITNPRISIGHPNVGSQEELGL